MKNWVNVAGTFFSPIDDALHQELFDAAFGPNDYRRSKSHEALFKERITLLSNGKYDPKDWELIGMEYLLDPCVCACGKAGVRKLYKVQNRKTKYAVGIGGSCLQKYLGIGKDEDVFEFLSKSFSKHPYRWLGKKFDTLILAALGFKRAYLYYDKREQKDEITGKDIKAIHAYLADCYGSFDASKWQRRLNRGMCLLHYLKRSRVAKQHSTIQIKRQNSFTPNIYPNISSSSQINARRIPGYENRSFMTMKREIEIVNGIWNCSCGGTYSKWGTSGPRQLPLMVCDKCLEEYIPDSDEECPF